MGVDQPMDTRENAHGKVTEKQCPACEEWWSVRGYNSHNRFCDGGSTDAEGGGNADESGETASELDLTSDQPSCPDCDGGVFDADQVAKLYRQNGHGEQADTIADHSFYCDNCHIAINEGEAYE